MAPYRDLVNPIVLRKARIVYNFGLTKCNMVKRKLISQLHYTCNYCSTLLI